MPYRDCPRLSWRLTASDFVPHSGSGYIYAGGPEERAAHVEVWSNAGIATLAEIVSQDQASFTVVTSGSRSDFPLRSQNALGRFIALLPDEVYLDITGLAHHIWAPLLRAALTARKRVWGVYVEPGEYTRTSTPTEGTIYDLSDRITGIGPLPGFATLQDTDRVNYAFAALLGFEGTRLIHVLEHVQPPGDATVPIIGIPGFRAEYPFVAYRGNRKPLTDGGYWVNARYATANCPFDLFFTLRSVMTEFQRDYLRVAPIGTKPHGLGAVLFALSAENRVELIYDHPIRKAGRTTGSARLCLYDITTFIGSEEFGWASTSP